MIPGHPGQGAEREGSPDGGGGRNGHDRGVGGLLSTLLVTAALMLSTWVGPGVLEHGIALLGSSAEGGGESPGDLRADSGAFWALTIVVCGGVELAILAGWCWIRLGKDWREALAMRRVPARALAGWGLVAVLFALGCDVVTWWVDRPIVPDLMAEAYRTAVWAPLFWLALVGVAPAVEELVFRGFLFGGVESSGLGRWGAIGLSTGLWAASHAQYDFWGLSIVILAGMLLGLARGQTRSVMVPWFMHMVLNAIAVAEAAQVARIP